MATLWQDINIRGPIASAHPGLYRDRARHARARDRRQRRDLQRRGCRHAAAVSVPRHGPHCHAQRNESQRAADVGCLADVSGLEGRNQSFEHLGIYRNTVVNLTGSGQPERLNGAVASSAICSARWGCRRPPAASSAPPKTSPDAPRVAIISERLWRGRFNADPEMLGRALVLNSDPHVVIGIMPPAMRFPSRLTDVWLPFGPLIATLAAIARLASRPLWRRQAESRTSPSSAPSPTWTRSRAGSKRPTPTPTRTSRSR